MQLKGMTSGLLAASLIALLAACSPAPDPTTASQPASAESPVAAVEPPMEDATSLSGDIIIDGSSTVFPVTSAAAEEFRTIGPDVRISVGVSGTGGGFKRFCAGETDISNASRPIKAEEAEACAAEGVQYIEIPVAYDGLAVVVNPANDWVECMTVPELKMVWEPDAQAQITNWNQIRPDFPDAPLVLVAPGSDSGTFDYFTEAIVGESKASRGDYQASEDDNVIVTGISGDLNALGYMGYAYVVANEGRMKPVLIDDGSGVCVAPSFDTVRDASYQPLSRPLFIYVRSDAVERPEVQAFVEYYLSPEFTSLIETPEIGYVTLDPAIYAAGVERFNGRTIGTLWTDTSSVGATLDRYLQP